MKQRLVCTPKRLPLETMVAAAETAVKINPLNHTPLQRLTRVVPEFVATPERIAVLTTKYWGLQGVSLTVGFLDNPPADLRKRILLHMNAWVKTANVKFVETKTNPQVRVARVEGQEGGYWSYLGTDIVHIQPKAQTMNLEAFTMVTHWGFRTSTCARRWLTRLIRRKRLSSSGVRRDGAKRKFVRRCSRRSKNPPYEPRSQIRNPLCATRFPAS